MPGTQRRWGELLLAFCAASRLRCRLYCNFCQALLSEAACRLRINASFTNCLTCGPLLS